MIRVHRRRERGSALATMAVTLVICGALSAAVLTTSAGRNREAQSELQSERAFELAEAGADWGVAQIRINHGTIPSPASETRTVTACGAFTVRYDQGDADGRDNDGDGIVDDVGEHDYAVIRSTGTSGQMSRTVEVLMHKTIDIPTFSSAVQINVETPVLNFAGNAFIVDGRDHLLDGTYDPDGTAKYGIASPAVTTDLTSQIDARNADQILGEGGSPSVGKVAAIDLDTLVDQAMSAADQLVQPGTHSNLALGEPTEAGVVIAYCNGDLHLSGVTGGAGILCVDGDLTISGTFLWTGIVIVRGRVNMVGGGGEKRVIGALDVGEEVGSDDSTTSVGVTGTVDLLYSSEGVALASGSLAITSILSWREVANPVSP
jgi:hypothetical protein